MTDSQILVIRNIIALNTAKISSHMDGLEEYINTLFIII